MIHLILTIKDAHVCDILQSRLPNWHPDTANSSPDRQVYADGVWRVAEYPNTLAIARDMGNIISRFAPDRIWVIVPAHGVHTERHMGDVVLPNVFLPFDTRMLDAEDGTTAELHDALFLTTFSEQGDYDFEHFGLSVGGIAVDTPPHADFSEETRRSYALAAEADAAASDMYALLWAAQSVAEDIMERLVVILPLISSSNTPVTDEQIISPYSAATARAAVENGVHILTYLIEVFSSPDGDGISLDFGGDDEEDENENEDYSQEPHKG